MNAIRRLARNVAKNRMKKVGMVRICKSGAKKGERSEGSYFSQHWKDHVKYGKEKHHESV